MNTMQQEFDAVVAHLFTQGRPAKGADGHSCLYRAGTLSCAVGCRIPDAVYTPDMDKDEDGEGTGIFELLERFEDELPEEIGEYRDLFARLQDVHDNCWTHASGEFLFDHLQEKLEVVAKEFGLTFTRPEGV